MSLETFAHVLTTIGVGFTFITVFTAWFFVKGINHDQ